MRKPGEFTTISTTVSSNFLKLLKDYHIPRAEALRVGGSVLLAELNVIPYDNSLNLYRRMMTYKKKLEELTAKMPKGA